MSAARIFATTAMSAFALLASAREASADRTARPVPYVLRGFDEEAKDYSKSVSNGEFGAGFQIYGRAETRFYESMCSSAATDRYCATLGAFELIVCRQRATQIRASSCNKTGVGITADGYAGADVTMFGTNIDLFDLKAAANGESTGSATTSWSIAVGGKKLMGRSEGAKIAASQKLFERSLVKASATFWVGPAPITVTADAVGSMGLDFDMEAQVSKASGKVTPWAAVNAELSAGIGTKGLSAGVYGDILLVKVSTPASAEVVHYGGADVRYNASLDLVVNALDGEAGMYAEFGPWRKNWSFISWDGLKYTQNLGKKSGYLLP